MGNEATMSEIKPEESRTAPDFNLIGADGKTVRLSDYRGEKIVLLVFNRGFV